MMVILVSCTCLALTDPLDRSCSKTKCKQLKNVNMFVLWFFVAEMVIKMTAMGMFGKRSYFADGWNRLDFLIVTAGIVDEFSGPEGAFLITIRLVRVLRPLRAINRVPSIRILVTLLLEALPLLGNVFALAFLVLFIFGIVGVQLWQGVLRNRCFLNSTLIADPYLLNLSSPDCYYQTSFEQPDFLCSLPGDSGMQQCSGMPLQSSCWSHLHTSGNHCYDSNSSIMFNNSYFSCSQQGPNPFYTTVSFDNIGYAWMVIFQIITLEGWTNIMYLIQEAYGFWNWIYFVILILIGPFFLVNLCLVVLAMQFQETRSRELQLLEEDRRKKIEAEKVFKGTKWGKVMNVVKTSISESLQKRAAEHVHHHHHIHHYYHHKHVLQTPASPTSVPIATTSTDVVLSHDNPKSPSILRIQQEPSDPVISLELTSNCKISQNFLSPTQVCSGRSSPTWSLGSADRFSVISDTVHSHVHDDLANVASASATVSVNVTSGKMDENDTCSRPDVFASAGASASVTTAQVLKDWSQRSTQKQEPSQKTKTTWQNARTQPGNQNQCNCSSQSQETSKRVNQTYQDPSSDGQNHCNHSSQTGESFKGVNQNVHNSQLAPTNSKKQSSCSCESSEPFQKSSKTLQDTLEPNKRQNNCFRRMLPNLQDLLVPTIGENQCKCRGQTRESLRTTHQNLQDSLVPTNSQNQCNCNAHLHKMNDEDSLVANDDHNNYNCTSQTGKSFKKVNQDSLVLTGSQNQCSGQPHESFRNKNQNLQDSLLPINSQQQCNCCGQKSFRKVNKPLRISPTNGQNQCSGDGNTPNNQELLKNTETKCQKLLVPNIITTQYSDTISTTQTEDPRQTTGIDQNSLGPLTKIENLYNGCNLVTQTREPFKKTNPLQSSLVPINGQNRCSNFSLATKTNEPLEKADIHENSLVPLTSDKNMCNGSSLATETQESPQKTDVHQTSLVPAGQSQCNNCSLATRTKQPPLENTSANDKNQPSSTTLKTLDISTLKFDVNDNIMKSPRGLYRQRSCDSSSVFRRSNLSIPERQRSSSQRSLDDRFGSMFDIRRYAQYHVSHDITRVEKFRHVCGRVANSSLFINFIMVVIIINTILMATEHYGQSDFLDEFLEICNLIFISIFSIELVIKVSGEGIRAYVNQWFNIFDGFIVIISVIEVIVLRGGGGLSVLRSIRLLRIFRLIRPIRHQLIVMIHTMASVVTFTALLFLFMFTFAVLGMNIFGGKMSLPTADCEIVNVRSNFDTFFAAMVTIFQVLTLEDWNVVMQNAMRSTTHWAAVYFITLTVIGYYVLFNLLVAILVEGFTDPLLFDSNAIKEKEEQKNNHQKRTPESAATTDWLDLIKRVKAQPMVDKPGDDVDDSSSTAKPETSDTKSSPQTVATSSTYCRAAVRGVIGKPNRVQNIFGNAETSQKVVSTNPESTKDENSSQKVLKSLDLSRNSKDMPASRNSKRVSANSDVDHCFSRKNQGFTNDSPVSEKLFKPQIIVTGADEVTDRELVRVEEGNGTRNNEKTRDTLEVKSKSLFIFSESNRFRRLMVEISSSKWFDYFILFLIVISCVFMARDHPNASTQHSKLLFTASFIFTVLFTLEVMIKVVAQGLVIGKNAYLRHGWNILDSLIVVISWLHIIITSFSSTSPGVLGSVKVLRGLRTLRPLRMIRRAPGLKLVVEALLRSLKPIGNTVLIAGIFFVVFGVLGVQLFKGTFYHCDGDSGVKTKEECLKRNIGRWTNRPYNFDNLAQALVTLFVLATRDGWVTLMHHGVDAVGINRQPQVNHDQWKVIYFISFLMVVGFLVLNMVVGIVVNNYQLCQERQEQTERNGKRNKRKTVDEENIVIEDKSKNVPPEELYHLSSFRTRCLHLCHNKYWDIAIAFVICVNVILMALEHYNMSQNYKIFLDVNNYICTVIFIVEAFIKLTAFGCRGYFRDRWNILDFLIVVFSVVGIILDLIHNTVNLLLKPTVIRGLRVMRIIRVFKLFKVAKGVRSLLDTITKSLPQVANLGILLFLLFFIYSSLGIQLFGSLECSEQFVCHGLDTHANFHDFETAMLTLFRVATGDNWNTIYMDTLRSTCDGSVSCEKNCCYIKYVAPVYFTTFVLATHFVLLNVLVAVLMKDLKASREKIAAVLSRETLDKRVLKMTISATNFVRKKAFSKKSSEKTGGEDIELKNIRSSKPPD